MVRTLAALVLILASQTMGNIGGTFYRHAVSGLSVDSGTTVVDASTAIVCVDTVCGFRTVYKTNSAGALFRGRFYGTRFTNIRINGIACQIDSLNLDSIRSDSALFGRRFVLDRFVGFQAIASIPVRADVLPDSTIVIEGDLLPEASEDWGLGALTDVNRVSLRHFLLQRPNWHNNEYSLAYVLAPIETFKGLRSARVSIYGKNVTIEKRIIHRPVVEVATQTLAPTGQDRLRRSPRDWDSVASIRGPSDSAMFTGLIPDVVEYRYSLDRPPRSLPVVSPGGPILFLGARRKEFLSEVGWECSINVTDGIAFLPSAFAAFGPHGYTDWGVGLRGYFLSFSVGIVTREFRSVEATFGLDIFGVPGIEGRNDAVFGKLSM